MHAGMVYGKAERDRYFEDWVIRVFEEAYRQPVSRERFLDRETAALVFNFCEFPAPISRVIMQKAV